MYQHESHIRVRYAETDQMGYVYYGNYSAYYESGRVEALRALGLTYRKMEAEGVMMPVLENISKYYKPARYDDLLTIKTRIEAWPKVKVRFHYDIYNENGDHLHKGETLLIFIDIASGRPCAMPKDMAEALKPFFENEVAQ